MLSNSPLLNPVPEDDKPPLFRTWRRLYVAIVVYLSSLILLFYLFTQAYRFPQ